MLCYMGQTIAQEKNRFHLDIFLKGINMVLDSLNIHFLFIDAKSKLLIFCKNNVFQGHHYD